MPFEDYRDDLKNQLLTQRVIRQEVSGKIQFKKEELKAYYDAHHDEFMRQERIFLREILVSTEGKDAAGVAAAEKKAKDLVALAKGKSSRNWPSPIPMLRRPRRAARCPRLKRDNC